MDKYFRPAIFVMIITIVLGLYLGTAIACEPSIDTCDSAELEQGYCGQFVDKNENIWVIRTHPTYYEVENGAHFPEPAEEPVDSIFKWQVQTANSQGTNNLEIRMRGNTCLDNIAIIDSSPDATSRVNADKDYVIKWDFDGNDRCNYNCGDAAFLFSATIANMPASNPTGDVIFIRGDDVLGRTNIRVPACSEPNANPNLVQVFNDGFVETKCRYSIIKGKPRLKVCRDDLGVLNPLFPGNFILRVPNDNGDYYECRVRGISTAANGMFIFDCDAGNPRCRVYYTADGEAFYRCR
jgi:hypothetical protein